MFERRFTIAALGLACLFAAPGIPPVAAQPAAPPPAVLVEPAELTPIADQAEFIGRAAAVDKVDLRARVKGFLGPRKFKDGDAVKKDEIVFTIEPETYQAAVDQKKAQRDSAQAALTNADLQLNRAAELLRTNTGTKATYDQRLSEQLQAKANLEDANAQLRELEPILLALREQRQELIRLRDVVLESEPDEQAASDSGPRSGRPELAAVLKAHGVHNYSIFREPGSGWCLACVEIEDETRWQAIARTEVCQRWWKSMAHLMATHPDSSPVATELAEVFHLD